MSFKVQTPSFSGPFDLLLSLVSKQKLDIGTIRIGEVCDQYLAEVERMRDMDMEVASDFVLVASTLLELKAQTLVPDDFSLKRDDDDDFDDELENLTPDEARELLIARLLAYKQFRAAAAALGSRMELQGRMLYRSAGPDPEFLGLMPDFLEGITLRSLAVICADLDSRRESLLLEAEHIAPKRIPVALSIASVERMIRTRTNINFSELLDGDSSPEFVVVTFLAVLELFKHGSIEIKQAEVFGDIAIHQVKDAQPYDLGSLEDAYEGDTSYNSESHEEAYEGKEG